MSLFSKERKKKLLISCQPFNSSITPRPTNIPSPAAKLDSVLKPSVPDITNILAVTLTKLFVSTMTPSSFNFLGEAVDEIVIFVRLVGFPDTFWT